MATIIQRFVKNLRPSPVSLLISAFSLLVGGIVVRYFLASPTAGGDDFMMRNYPLPTDPLNLAFKWFLVAFILAAVGGWMWFRSVRKTQGAGSKETTRAGSASAFHILPDMILLPAFWLALVCAVEFSSTKWTFVAWSEPSSKITTEMKEDPHFLIFDSRSPGSDSSWIVHIISQGRSNTAVLLMAQGGYPDAAGLARDRFRAADRRTVAAIVSWIITAILAGAFIVFSRKGRTGEPTVSDATSPESEPDKPSSP